MAAWAWMELMLENPEAFKKLQRLIGETLWYHLLVKETQLTRDNIQMNSVVIDYPCGRISQLFLMFDPS